MNSKLFAAALLLSALPGAFAGTTVIGTVNARGDLRVDGYPVKGNATLFDGTVVETHEASAAIHLKSGAEIKLSTNSRGLLYHDRLVLQRGASEMTPSNGIVFEARGLQVTQSGPNAKGTISIGESDTVAVAALSGQFRVSNGSGQLLAKVDPGKPLSFATPSEQDSQLPTAAMPTGPVKMSIYGTLSRDGDHYYLNLPAPDIGYVYEVQGANLEAYVGKLIIVSGTVDVHMRPVGHANYVLIAQNVTEEHISNPMSAKKKAILATLILGGAAGAAIGTYEANQSPTPASR